MTDYAIGDIQGCLRPLQNVLHKIEFSPKKDRLWVVGDLVNRGPDSLSVLRLLYEMRNSLRVVLGNHDLHLLAVAAGQQKTKPGDTLTEVLCAPDAKQLLHWLRRQALLIDDPKNNWLMVHAGLPPVWDLEQAVCHAREVENVLRGPDYSHFLKYMYGDQPEIWSESLRGMPRLRLICNYLTRMRLCDKQGRLALRHKGSPDTNTGKYKPWYAHSQRKISERRILFGHWSALRGQVSTPGIYALDQGCVWGGELCVLRLEDCQRFAVPGMRQKKGPH